MSYLEQQMEHTYLRDIKERYEVRQDSDLSELVDIMASCVGGLTNPPKIADTFKSVKHSSISVDTIRLYLEYMEDAFVLERDIKGRKYIDSPFKYYIGDIFDSGVMFKVSVDEGSTWTPTCVFSYLRDDRLLQVCDNIDFSAIEKCYDSVQPKEGDFIKVIEDDLRYINFSMNELSQNQTNPSRESELRDAYNRLENWLSDYKQSLV